MSKYFLVLSSNTTTGLDFKGPYNNASPETLAVTVGFPLASIELDETTFQGMDGEDILSYITLGEWKDMRGLPIKGIWWGISHEEWTKDDEEGNDAGLVVQFTPDDQVLEETVLLSMAFIVLKRRAQIKLAA